MTALKSPDYSVVVPVRDEAGNIMPLVSEIVTAMDALDGAPSYEILYVDDGSIDETATELAKAAETHPALTWLRHSANFGQSQALLTGVEAARSPWIITLDGDGQNDPADIALLIARRNEQVEKESDVANHFLYIGHRHMRHDSLARRYQSWLANDIRGWLLGDHTPDTGCGLKLIRRDLFLSLPRFDALHRFLPALAIRAGGRAISVEISHRPRLSGRSKYGFWRRFVLGVVDLLGVMWLIARHTQPSTTQDISQTKDSK